MQQDHAERPHIHGRIQLEVLVLATTEYFRRQEDIVAFFQLELVKMNVRAILKLDAARRVKENVLHTKHSLEAAGKPSERALVALAAQVI